MKNIALYITANEAALPVAPQVIAWLEERGIKVRLLPDTAERFKRKDLSASFELFLQADLILTLGGDGTFLHAARLAAPAQLPVLGINLGRLGFLTEITLDSWRSDIEQVLSGKYRLEERITLNCKVYRAGKVVFDELFINDAVLHRGAGLRMLQLAIYIDEKFAGTFAADGLIVSTPTGSTAYSLSAGGPIISPKVEGILVNAICPHTLSARPLVISVKEDIKIMEKHGLALNLSVDGQLNFTLQNDDIVKIAQSHLKLKFVYLEKNFYDLLREKLKWVF
jgi:NAD+ kinase